LLPEKNVGRFILAIVGVDPNNQMVSIAYVMAEEESYDNWKWFLQMLIND